MPASELGVTTLGAGFSKDLIGRRGDFAGGDVGVGNGSKGSKEPNDCIESPFGLGKKLRGRELRLGASLSLSPPYKSPIASVT